MTTVSKRFRPVIILILLYVTSMVCLFGCDKGRKTAGYTFPIDTSYVETGYTSLPGEEVVSTENPSDCKDTSEFNYPISVSNQDVYGDVTEHHEEERYVVCPACRGTGESYEATVTPIIDRDMISGAAGRYICPVCLGRKAVPAAIAAELYETVMGIYGSMADVDAARRSQPCWDCRGFKKCRICNDDPYYRHDCAYCHHTGNCPSCYGHGHNM